MTKYFMIWALGMLSFAAQAIGSYAVKDTLYVLGVSGLKLRNSPKLAAGTMTVVPYASQVIVKEITVVNESVEEAPGYFIKGSWVKVGYGNKEGYVFDGYLSSLPPPAINEKSIKGDTTLENYLLRRFVQIGETMKSAKGNETNQRFSRGIKLTKRFSEKTGEMGRAVIDDIFLEEGFLIARTLCQTVALQHKPGSNYETEGLLNVKYSDTEINIEPTGKGLSIKVTKEVRKVGQDEKHAVVLQYRWVNTAP
jgi:hypothetical protein